MIMATTYIEVSAEDLAPDRQWMAVTANPVPDLSVQVDRGAERPQLRDPDTGMLMWEVQVLRMAERFGRAEAEIIGVQVGAPERPPAEGMVQFAGLGLRTKVEAIGDRRRDGGVYVRQVETTRWYADEVRAVGASRPQPRKAEGGDAS